MEYRVKFDDKLPTAKEPDEPGPGENPLNRQSLGRLSFLLGDDGNLDNKESINGTKSLPHDSNGVYGDQALLGRRKSEPQIIAGPGQKHQASMESVQSVPAGVSSLSIEEKRQRDAMRGSGAIPKIPNYGVPRKLPVFIFLSLHSAPVT